MELTCVRDIRTDVSTTSILSIDGVATYFVLEDVDRGDEPKQKGRTAIPVGRYKVETTWSPKYQRPMPLLLDVPGFQGIRIHSGNKHEDTEGCLLVGTKRSTDFVGNSRVACKALYALIADAEAAGEEVWITITRAGEATPRETSESSTPVTALPRPTRKK